MDYHVNCTNQNKIHKSSLKRVTFDEMIVMVFARPETGLKIGDTAHFQVGYLFCREKRSMPETIIKTHGKRGKPIFFKYCLLTIIDRELILVVGIEHEQQYMLRCKLRSVWLIIFEDQMVQ